MPLIRLSIAAAVVVMLLPGPSRSGAAPHDFCGHYPKTCAASVEIQEALKYKLAFATSWVKENAGAASAGLQKLTGKPDGAPQQAGGGTSAPYTSAPYENRFDGGTLTTEDRYPAWRGAAQQSRDYPGR